MKKQEITKMVALLEESKKFIVEAGETAFDELNRRTKVKIFDLFDKAYTADTDGDDGDYYFTYGGNYEDGSIRFIGRCEDEREFREYIMQMEIFIAETEDYEDVTVDVIDKVITHLRNLLPEVIGVLNTSILTVPGDYSLKQITLERAREIAQSYTLDSAIGHASTAKIMTDLLGVNIPENRQQFVQDIGQQCLVFKLRGRVPEGSILSAAEIEKIGYDFQLLIRNS